MSTLCFYFVFWYNAFMQNKAKEIIANIISGIVTVVCVFLLLLSICFLTYNACYSKTRVRGHSMLPTINKNVEDIYADGDTVFINTHEKLKANTIVVANVNWWQSGSIIKRLVALPGDSVQVEETATAYNLNVNVKLVYSREKYNENGEINTDIKNYYQHKYLPFVNNLTYINGQHIDHSQNISTLNGNSCIVLNDNEYFLIGDNWTDSMIDCMTYGPVNKSNIVGTVDLIVDVEDNIVMSVTKDIFRILFSV